MMMNRAQRRVGWATLLVIALACFGVAGLSAPPRAKAKPPAKKPASKAAKPVPAKAKPPARKPAPAPAPALSAGGVEITSPESDAKLRGVATVRVSWSNPRGYIIFRVDDKFVFASTAPYLMKWDTSTLADGSHVLDADAFDSAGKYEGSSSVKVEVKNTLPTPDNGVLLSVRFGSEDMLARAVNARSEISSMAADEALPATYSVLAGSLQGSLTQTVMDPFYQGTSVLLRNRLKDGWLTVQNLRSALPDVGQYAMVTVSRNGLVVPNLTAVRKTRLSLGEISLALPDYPVFAGDTWQSPLGAVVDLFTRRTVYVQGQHTFEGLRWFNGRECAMITSTYTVPTLTLYEAGTTQGALPGSAGLSLELTQMRGGAGGRGGGGGGGGRGARGGGGGGGGTRARAGATGQAGQTGRGAQAQGQLQSVRLTGLEGMRVTYLARRSGRILHIEDTVKGKLEFRTAGAVSTSFAPDSAYSVQLTQMRGGGGRGGGGGGGGRGARGGGGGGGGTRARTGAGTAGTRAGQTSQTGRTAQPGQPAPTRVPSSLDYAFRLSTDLVAR